MRSHLTPVSSSITRRSSARCTSADPARRGCSLAAAGCAVPTAALADPAPASFRVGAAIESIDPLPGVPVYSGGFEASPPITKVLEPLEVRAIYISNGTHAVLMATVDCQAYFAAYQEGPYGISDVRQTAAAEITAGGGLADADEGPEAKAVGTTQHDAVRRLAGSAGAAPARIREVAEFVEPDSEHAAGQVPVAEPAARVTRGAQAAPLIRKKAMPSPPRAPNESL